MFFIKELLLKDRTGSIHFDMKLDDLVESVGTPEYIYESKESEVKVTGVHYNNGSFLFNSDKLLMGYAIKFIELEDDPDYDDKSIYTDYLECRRMTNKEWLQFFENNGLEVSLDAIIKDEYEDSTSYFVKKVGYLFEFILCNLTDRIIAIGCLG